VGVEENEISQKANGGTELISRAIQAKVDPELLDHFQIIPSRVELHTLNPDKIRILHCHDLVEQQNAALANGGWQRFHKLVFVSNWQMQRYIEKYGIPWNRCAVVQNAIEPLQMKQWDKSDDVVRLIYHSTPHRGLDILTAVFEKIASEDEKVELDVFSSFALYGWDERDAEFKEMFDKLTAIPRVHNHGAVSNALVRDAVVKADIFVYPSTWPETSCLCLIEAMSAGLVCIHPNYAALFETASNWTTQYQWNEDKNEHATLCYGLTKHMISMVRERNDNLWNRLNNQSQYTNSFYSWDYRIEQWNGLLKSLLGVDRALVEPEEMFSYEVR
jgi:UDP-glucose:(glucosyl)LPS alpha-1,2-glucosyltransferase